MLYLFVFSLFIYKICNRIIQQCAIIILTNENFYLYTRSIGNRKSL
nr:MAG TPA: hypothetical protein [Caudoviricetes sp.]